MRISEVKITNFRTIYEANINFFEVTSFIGPNGVGKSTILYALEWFFNGSRNGSLTSEDATYGHENEDIEVRVTFDQLNEEDRSALGKYVGNTDQTFSAWKIRTHLDGEERLSANAKGYAMFTDLKDPSLTAKELKDRFKDIRDKHPELGLNNKSTKNAILEELMSWEADHPDNLVNVPENLSTNFNGFNSNEALASRFRFTLVKADLRANEEATDGRNSLLSDIVERAINRKSADEQLIEAYSTVQEQEQKIYDQVFGESLAQLSTRLNSVVNDYTNNRSIEIKPNVQNIVPPKTTFKIEVNDGDYQTDVTHQGHGFQRTLLISALQLLSERKNDDDNGVLCLAIEEPELFQHPLQAKVFSAVLRELASEVSNGIQVTYATHSPFFLEEQHFNQVYRLVRFNNDSSYNTKIFNAGMNEVVEDLLRYSNNPKIDFLTKVYANDLSDGIFSNGVILVEGTTDRAIIEEISEKTKGITLSRKGIAIISCGSKSRIPQFFAILSRLGIPTQIMFDNDSGWEGRAKNEGNSRENERQQHISENKKLLQFFQEQDNFDNKDFPLSGIHGKLFIVEDTLETYLTNNWRGWKDKIESIQKEHENLHKKNAELYLKAIRELPMTDCPKEITRFLEEMIERC